MRKTLLRIIRELTLLSFWWKNYRFLWNFFMVIFMGNPSLRLSEVLGSFKYQSSIFSVRNGTRNLLTLNALITTKVCFSCLLKCLRSLYDKQCGPRSDCSYRSSLFRSTLFASILNLSVMLGSYLQQTTSADDIFRYIFFLAL